MYPELQKLIEMAILDGNLTVKKREIILRKAEKIGYDIDEVEMYLENMLLNTSVKPPTNKEGQVFKCPSCGETVDSFVTNCFSCGHEFRGSENRSKVKELVLALKKIEDYEWENNTYNGNNGQPRLDHMVRNGIASKQCNLIENFPIPNTKEDLLEFLALAMPIGLKKFSWSEKFTHTAEVQLQKSYKSKAQQVIIKARVAFNRDKILSERIETYAKQLGIK